MRISVLPLACVLLLPFACALSAQTASDAPVTVARTSQRGTVKSIAANSIVLASDTGVQFTVLADPPAKVMVLAPGSTDLKIAQPGTVQDISVGDRVLVTGKPGEANSIVAQRVIVMRSADIAQRNASQQADWQKRGSGGIVSAVDSSSITVKSGSRSVKLVTAPTTIYRRYAPGSIKFEEAIPGTLSQIVAGDQLRVRGDKSEDGASIAAEEIVSGSFRNVSGTIASIDATQKSITIKDLATKKNVVVRLSAESDLRNLPPQMAATLATRSRGGASGAPGSASGAAAMASGARRADANVPSATTPTRSPAPAVSPASSGNAPAEASASANTQGMASGRPAGGDLAQMVARLPTTTLAELKPGEALMIVASQGAPTEPLTAITVLSGVEPILAATPSGAQPLSLSPWNLGIGGGDAAAGGAGPQ